MPVTVDHLLGACMAVPRRVLSEVGLLDSRFFMFLEETDLCYRIKKAGYGIRYLPQVEIIHYGGRSTSQVPDMKRRLYESQLLFLRKYGASARRILLFKVVIALAAAVRMLLWFTRLITSSNRRLAASTAASYARLMIQLARY